MARKSFLFAVEALIVAAFAFSSFAFAQHSSTDLDPKLVEHMKLASELTSRARANVYFTNQQDIFRGVQVNYVNVGLGNVTFLRRDLVASGRIPIVFARVYDSNSSGSADFGPGWMLSAAETISIENHTATLLSESGSRIEFVEGTAGIFTLSKDRPSDYLELRKTGDVLRLKLRTGLTQEFQLIGERFRLTTVADKNGNEIRLTYSDGTLSKIENANHSIEVKRDDHGRIAAIKDDQGRKISYHYDTKGRLIEADDIGGAPWLYTYTEGNKLKTATDPMKRLNFEVSYDDGGRVRHLRQPSGVIQFSYDRSGHATTVIDRKQLVSRYFQNDEGVTTRIVNPLGEETAIRFDDARNVISLSRNGSVVQSMEYDNSHRIMSRHGGAGSGGVVSYKYDPVSGTLIGIDAGNGSARAFGYDGNGNVSSAVTDDGLHRYGFSASGDLTAYSAKGLDLTFAPDSDGLIASMKDAKDNTSLSYKTGGELSTIAFADGSKATYEYQPSGLRAKLVYADGRQIRYTYDSAGNLLSTEIFDIKGKQVQGQKLTLNDSYQVMKRLLFDGTEESFEYDANGNLTKHTKNGAVTKFEYDELNRLVVVLTPAGERLTYTYTSGERSIVEQYEHSSILVADLIDSGFTFAHAFEVMATRPVVAPLGTIRFSESRGTFQLANASGSDIITPETTIEQALQKLTIVEHTTPLKRRQNLFNRPFNTIFMPAEYASINCCFSCSLTNCRPGALAGDGDTSGCCPPCDPPPPGGFPSGPPTPTITQQQDLWYFNGLTPPFFTDGAVQVVLSASPNDESLHYVWTITAGSNQVLFDNNSATKDTGNTNNLILKSISASKLQNDVKVQVTITDGSGASASSSITLTVKVPFAVTASSLPPTDQAVGFTCASTGTTGWRSEFSYTIVNQLGQPVKNAGINEQFLLPKVDVQPNNWPVPSEGGALASTGTFFESICVDQDSINPRNPAPLIPQSPLTAQVIDKIPQDWKVGDGCGSTPNNPSGSCSLGIHLGTPVLRNNQTRYIDHGRHTDIKSPE